MSPKMRICDKMRRDKTPAKKLGAAKDGKNGRRTTTNPHLCSLELLVESRVLGLQLRQRGVLAPGRRGGVHFACQTRRLCSLTFTAVAAALNEYFYSETSRTATRSNTSLCERRRRRPSSCSIASIYRTFKDHYPAAPLSESCEQSHTAMCNAPCGRICPARNGTRLRSRRAVQYSLSAREH
jgi:hypothetical protein